MRNHQPSERGFTRSEGRIRIESDSNPDLARSTAKFIIDAAALERARLEADAQAEVERGQDTDHD